MRTRGPYYANKRIQNKIYRNLKLGIDKFQTGEAQNLLFDFQTVCETEDVKFFLSFGTLLGAYRDHDILPYDTDVDVCMAGRQNHDKLLKLIEEGAFLKKNIMTSHPDRTWSFIRNGCYLDVYPLIFNKVSNLWEGRINDGAPLNQLTPDKFPLKKFLFLGRYFYIPNNTEDFLVERYGKDWKIPKENAHARS